MTDLDGPLLRVASAGWTWAKKVSVSVATHEKFTPSTPASRSDEH